MASFSLPDSSSLQRAAVLKNSICLTARDWDEIATALLEDRLVLTALELYTELLESGKEVQCLKDYFSNPGNFEHVIPQVFSGTGLLQSIIRTSSLSTFDSIELGRYSDDLDKEHDDKVAVLEFELRKAYDTIKSLRGSLTEAIDICPTKSSGPTSIKPRAKSDEPIKHHEMKALNFLAHEYLMQQNFKLSAITLTEENGNQDFDDWDDVGLNIPKPPALLQLFRNYSAALLSDKERLERIQDLEDQLSLATGQCLALNRENEGLQLRLKKRTSVTSLKSGREKQHKRAGSLGNRQKVGHLELHHQLNRSSPEFSAKLKKTQGDSERDKGIQQVERRSETKSLTSDGGDNSRVTSAGILFSVGGDGNILDNLGKNDDGVFSQSPTIEEIDETVTPSYKTSLFPPLPYRSISANSSEDISLVVTSSDERAGTIHSDISGSCSTLQNERPDGEIESSLEQSRKQQQQMSVSFRRELLSVSQVKTESRVGLEVAKMTESDFDLVHLLGRSLPHIIPIVPLSKREELVPVLLGTLVRQSDSKAREQLLHMMFNLTKKPDKAQRQVIMSSCVAFSKLSGSSKVESELLPQMWEQITHKSFERRLLVAESCGVLAPYIPPELRGSLVLSMLKQMLTEDKAESVRQAIVRSLAVIVAFTDDEEKFKLCWELMLRALNDPSQLVVTSTYSVLLPALAAWSFELGSLESNLVSYFLHQLLTCTKQVFRSDGESRTLEQAQHHLLTLTHLVPWHYATILQTGPYCDGLSLESETFEKVVFPKPLSPLLDLHVIIGDDTRLGALVASFKQEVEAKAFVPWKSLDWFQNDFLNKITRITVTLGFSQPQLIHSLSNLLSAYCTYLGHSYTRIHVGPYFERCLKLPKSNPGAAIAEGKTQLTTPLLTVYVAGILGCFSQDEGTMITYFSKVVVDLALYFSPLDSLRSMVAEICRERRRHSSLLQGFRKLAEHSSFQVRRYVAILLGVMVRKLEERVILKSMLPLLIKLSRDSEISVKVGIIESFGIIMETGTSKDVLMRVHEQFESFMGVDLFQMDHQMIMAVLRTLAKIGPRADPVFRDKFIMPKLANVASMNNISQNVTKRKDVALSLLDAYSNISECFLSADLLATYVVPSLDYLLRDMDDLMPDKAPLVEQLLATFNSKLQEHRKQELAAEQSDGKTGAFFKKFRPSFDRTTDLTTSRLFKKKT